jgi:hypothetical protein
MSGSHRAHGAGRTSVCYRSVYDLQKAHSIVPYPNHTSLPDHTQEVTTTFKHRPAPIPVGVFRAYESVYFSGPGSIGIINSELGSMSYTTKGGRVVDIGCRTMHSFMLAPCPHLNSALARSIFNFTLVKLNP